MSNDTSTYLINTLINSLASNTINNMMYSCESKHVFFVQNFLKAMLNIRGLCTKHKEKNHKISLNWKSKCYFLMTLAAPVLIRINLYVRSISRIDDVKMVRFCLLYLLMKCIISRISLVSMSVLHVFHNFLTSVLVYKISYDVHYCTILDLVFFFSILYF